MDFAPDARIVLGGAKDLPYIYEDMQQQFPPNEMYKLIILTQLLDSDQYKILLYKRDSDEELIGYALVYEVESNNILWIDYLAVRKKYQSCGYGNALFLALWQKYCGSFDGMLFSVEHISQSDPVLAEQQKRRLSFYEHLGAHRLHAEFLQPYDAGSFGMYLYFKPRPGSVIISREVQMQVISQMYDYCFFYMERRKELLPLYENTILDEQFND
jgi:hypothetical protein